MNKSLVLLFFLSVNSMPIALASDSSSSSVKIKPFATDYCTMFIEGNWAHCCLDHDLRYWIGGERQDQDQSDLELRACVRDAAGPVMAGLIYYSVRSGHYSPIKHKYRWSWGWGEEEVFEALSDEQKKAAVQEIRSSEVDEEVVERFVRDHLE